MVCGKYVVKEKGDVFREPNLKLVKELVDKDAILFTNREKSIGLL
jgi:hypothetical protein